MQSLSWRASLLGLSILGVAAASGGRPTLAEGRPAAARPGAITYYDGSGTVQGGERPLALAISGRSLFGLLGGLPALDDASKGGRVGGRATRTGVTGSIYTPKNRRNGTVRGAFADGVLEGSYRLGALPEATWSAAPVAPDATAMSAVGGSYRAEGIPRPGEVTGSFNSAQNTFSLLGTARIGAGRLTILRVSGNWIADANGNLFLLARQSRYNRVPGAPSLPFPLPRTGTVAKVNYRIVNNRLTLIDPQDPDDPLLELTRR